MRLGLRLLGIVHQGLQLETLNLGLKLLSLSDGLVMACFQTVHNFDKLCMKACRVSTVLGDFSLLLNEDGLQLHAFLPLGLADRQLSANVLLGLCHVCLQGV